MALDPSLYLDSRSTDPWLWAVTGRPIRLLSGAVPLYAPTVKLPWRTAYLCTHIFRDITCDLTFVPPSPTPPTKKVTTDTTPWFVLS